MRRRRRVFLPLAFAALALAGCDARRDRRPNVLFVIADDLSCRVSLYGDGARTPNLERLARRGRRFDRAYCQYPLCSPSRTSLFTGWRPEKTQVWGNLRPPRELVKDAVPLQEHFEAQGYFTARVGKVYHSRFEDEFRWNAVVDTYDTAPADESSPEWGPSNRPEEDEPDGRAARKAVELLEARRDKPLFLAVGFLKPHDPWIVPDKFLRMYPPESVVPPERANDEQVLGARLGAPMNIPAAQERTALAAYYASATFMDAQLGLVLDALDRRRLWDSTVVVFIGDNGMHVGEHGLFGKMTLFEASARVPMVIAAPGLQKPGEPTDRLAELVDLYPTLVELCRLPKVDGLDGSSLAPLLHDPRAGGKDAAYTMRKVGATKRGLFAQSVRTERYRYTEYPGDVPELYDEQQDPREARNLFAEPSSQPIVIRMKALLDRQR